jgi:opacity protein-like surface antigen
MKKLVLIGVLCLSLTAVGFSMGFSIKATGGLSMLFGGDYNSAVQGQNDYYNALTGVTVNSELSKLSLGIDFGAEFILQFTDSMGIGLGVGYITASNESTLQVHEGALSLSQTYAPSVSVVPFTLNFHYFLPLGSSLRLHFFGGPGLYLASIKYDSTLSLTLGAIELGKAAQAYTPDSKLTFGFQGGLGIEFGLSRNIALLLDVAGRYLSISSISGSWIMDGHEGIIPVHITGTGTLYYYEVKAGGNYYGDLTISDTVPSNPNYRNVRAASISLSGIQFQTGLRISF